MLVDTPNAEIIQMSTLSEEGVINVKNLACKKLLEMRVEQKLANKKLPTTLNRLHLAVPKPRDDKVCFLLFFYLLK
jgi:nucleolar GTP-binding protein